MLWLLSSVPMYAGTQGLLPTGNQHGHARIPSIRMMLMQIHGFMFLFVFPFFFIIQLSGCPKQSQLTEGSECPVMYFSSRIYASRYGKTLIFAIESKKKLCLNKQANSYLSEQKCVLNSAVESLGRYISSNLYVSEHTSALTVF